MNGLNLLFTVLAAVVIALIGFGVSFTLREVERRLVRWKVDA